jgi:acid phosphatase (class A)
MAHKTRFHTALNHSVVGFSLLLMVGCATTNPVGAAASIVRTYASPATGTGYDWTQLLPKAPEAGGEVDTLDMATVRGYQSLQGTPRWAQAKADASLDVMATYGPIIGADFTPTKRPEMVALLAYSGKKFSEASNEAKAAFPRPRPFLADPTLTMCVTERPGGSSYPSGHSGWGWLSAQIVARVEPTFTLQLLARGRDYGLSRAICGVHYPSDVEAGRIVADAVLVRLDNDAEYQRLLAAAKAHRG